MKNILFLLLLSCILYACHTPVYYVNNGNYDKAVDVYLENSWREGFKREKFVRTAETAYARALENDLDTLSRLQSSNANSIYLNSIYRRIQSREKRVTAAGPIKSHNGYRATFHHTPDIDSLESDSRRAAAAYLYQRAQNLLAAADSSGRPEPAREAYFTLKTLKNDYYPSWENADQLMDIAHRAGKAYWYAECNALPGLSDAVTFWSDLRIDSNTVKNEWAVFTTDSSLADYRVKCTLMSLYVGSESTSTTETTESKQVEDGYDEVKDSSGKVVSRTTKYKTVTTTTYTYSSSRSADGTLMLEIIDQHNGQTAFKQALNGSHSFSGTSDIMMPSAPSYWGMIDYVADDLEWQLKRRLKKILLPNSL